MCHALSFKQPPDLRLSFGSREQSPVQGPGEPLEKFERRKDAAQRRRMADNCSELYNSLLKAGYLRVLEMKEYPDEDHGSVIAPALNGAIVFMESLLSKMDDY